MHYYGIFALARAAGLNHEAAHIIATASQFVDDNGNKGHVIFDDGGRIDFEATAHHTTNLKNTNEEDQRQIWVPFHFLPGNEGDTFLECLVCRKDSEIAREMVEHNLSNMHQPFALEVAGITAHVYADTFSHYGFSGVSDSENKIVNDSFDLGVLKPSIEKYLEEKATQFLKRYGIECAPLEYLISYGAEKLSCALGHGAALAYPDRPYLVWSFVYEKTRQRCEDRNNPRTFLEGCAGLYKFFRNIAEARPEFAGKGFKTFEEVKQPITHILIKQAKKNGRINAWKTAVQEGVFFTGDSQRIPPYMGDRWHREIDVLKKTKWSKKALDMPLYRFLQAAAFHRTYVLRTLLPAHGLVVA
ncbi:MAG TPA: hypothetical protein PKZ42_06180 [Syntrophales bacterium]|nr:hypothetical protein [Syntrophales bacterium]